MLRIIPLGGYGQVTRNMYLYEHDNDILLIDCGIGFPTEDMLGIDLLIPDVSYLEGKQDRIRGMILTHGHEDHIGALPYILPKLGGDFPIYASKLTAALAQEKLEENNVHRKINVVDTETTYNIGPYVINAARVSHSIPDTFHYMIKTPSGTVYHGADFKFDFTPVDGKQPETGKIATYGNQQIDLLITDCLGSERQGATPTERKLDEMFERELAHCKGKFIVTTMSSSISRLQQAIRAAVNRGRKVVLSGRSIEKNVQIALKLGYLEIDPQHIISSKQIKQYPDHQLAFLVAGSQGQPGSALHRIATGDHSFISINPGDKVVFSSDYIPGSETAIHWVIDTLYEQGATVVYSDIKDDLHVSGHGSRHDLMLLVNLTRPKFIYPVGGTYRHMIQYSSMVQDMGYKKENVLFPQGRTVLVKQAGDVSLGERINIRNVMVDGLGVGDVGKVVLRDRQVLAEEGVVIVLLQLDANTKELAAEPDIITRGFVYLNPNDNSLLSEAKQIVAKSLGTNKGRLTDWHAIKDNVADQLSRFFAQRLERHPMLIPVIIEV